MFDWPGQELGAPGFEDANKAHSATLLNLIMLIALGLTGLSMVAPLAAGVRLIPSLVIIAALLLVYSITLLLLRLGHRKAASILLTLALFFVASLITIFYGGIRGPGFSSYLVVVLIANLLLGNRVKLGFVLLSAAVCLGILFAEVNNMIGPLSMPGATLWMIQATNLVWIIILLYLTNLSFGTMLNQSRTAGQAVLKANQELEAIQASLQARTRDLERRMNELQVASAIARDAATVRELDDLLNRAVNLVCDRFGYFHAGIFLIDENREYAVLRAATGEAGQKLIAGNHRLKIGEMGIVGYVTGTGQPRVVLDVDHDPIHLKNPYMPDVRSEMTLPLRTSDLSRPVIGALDVQCLKADAFDDEDVAIMQVMADQLALAIEKTRLLETERRRAAELEELRQASLHLTSNLDLQPLLKAILEHALKLVAADDALIFLYDGDTLSFGNAFWAGKYQDTITYTPRKDGLTYQVARSGVRMVVSDVRVHPLYQDRPWDGAIAGLPLRSGSQVFGVMNVIYNGKPHAFTEDELRVLELLADQAAIALTNARLYSESRRQAEELVDALAQREELARLKNEFIQNVSHELRTPLTIVRGYVELLEKGEIGNLFPEQRELMSIISRRALMLSKIVDNFTTITEMEAFHIKRDRVDISGLLQMMMADFQASAGQAGISLVETIEPSLPRVIGNTTHVQLVLENLVSNAIKFTPEGGKVEIHLHREADVVMLEVIDTGVGIPEDEIDRIFERLYQVDGSTTRRFGGTGLGLAVVKEIVAYYGGEISVRSKLGEGSAFSVKFVTNL
ncbi:MAG: GAF domain-containing protein [Chloroflexota bacterium]|nr:MAG: GAF domain-containing protein [Chloroflexota bacterium]